MEQQYIPTFVEGPKINLIITDTETDTDTDNESDKNKNTKTNVPLNVTIEHQLSNNANIFSDTSVLSTDTSTSENSTTSEQSGKSSLEEPMTKEKLYEGYRTYGDVVRVMSEKFNTQDNINSTALDIISVYLKGQKIIQIESKIYCEYYLYRLMLPAIFISTISSVISGIFKDSIDASIVVCLLTAFNTFILSLVTYLKLDAKAEAHKTSAYSYDKLQTMCEFSSGRILLNTTCAKDSNYRTMGNLLDDIESKVMEIKEKNQFIIPAYIRNNYPKLYYTNIFSVVKQIQNEEIIYTNQLKVIMNLGTDIINEIKRGNTTNEMLQKRKQQYLDKNEAINNLIKFREKYYELDREFKREIEYNIIKKKKKWFSCCCKYSNSSCSLPTYMKSSSSSSDGFFSLDQPKKTHLSTTNYSLTYQPLTHRKTIFDL